MQNINIKRLFFSSLFPVLLFSSEHNFNYTQSKNSIINSFEDSDLDGVPNIYDKCPNTSLLDLVKENGCSKNQNPLLSSFHITISSGIIYSEKKRDLYRHKDRYEENHMHHQNNNIWQIYKELYIPVNISATNNNWLYSLTTGYLYTKDGDETTKSISDTYLSVGYIFDMTKKNLPVFGLKSKLKIPTSQYSSKNDYSIQAEIYKFFDKHYIFTDIGYTASATVDGYKNFYYFDVDYSYNMGDFEIGTLYSFSKVSHNGNDIQNITLYNSYQITKNLELYIGYTTAFFDSRNYNSFAITISHDF